MITSLLIGLIAVLLYFVIRGERSRKFTNGISPQYLYLILLTGIFILLTLFNPELKEKVKILKRKLVQTINKGTRS